MKELIQHSPSHPGEILKDIYLDPLGLTISDASDKLKITRPNLSAIINGKSGISPLMAFKLSIAFDTTPQYWLNLQMNYDLKKEYDKNSKQLKEIEQLV